LCGLCAGPCEWISLSILPSPIRSSNTPLYSSKCCELGNASRLFLLPLSFIWIHIWVLQGVGSASQMLMGLAFAKVFWNNTTLHARCKSSLHRSFQFCLWQKKPTHMPSSILANSFPNFLAHVVLWKKNYATFKLISFIVKQTWSWLMAY
jgi:hypothetical protein